HPRFKPDWSLAHLRSTHESLEQQKDFAERLTQMQKAANQERASLKDQYFRFLFDLNNMLSAIQSTWSWRLLVQLILINFPRYLPPKERKP
ncbi:MAG: hypothetical protein ACREYF_26250, partial [Gammaproteobacteria bacterium]